MSAEKLSWKELKDFVNLLPEEVLEQDVVWWGDERGGKLVRAYKLHEDYICTEEGWEPKSIYEDDETCYTKDEVDDMPLLKKETPILSSD